MGFLSTLSLRRATAGRGHVAGGHQISIHALLAESDKSIPGAQRQPPISIHALLAESDVGGAREEFAEKIFLSTLSLRRATGHIHYMGVYEQISIHALLAESDFSGDHGHIRGDISIHALLAESDSICQAPIPLCNAFLSTLSLRRATGRINDISRLMKISIHALLAESDVSVHVCA